MSRIVLTTVGSFGDLHPKIALAIELRRRGHEVVFATHREYREKIEGLGFGFRRLRPDASALNDPREMARMMHPYRGQEYVIRRWLMPALSDTFEDLRQGAAGADLIISGEGVFAARLVAEKLGIPWVCTVLQPLAFLSRHDPFILPGLPLPAWLRNSGTAIRSAQLALIRAATRAWAAPVTALRKQLGLAPLSGNLFVDDKYSHGLVLALFSRVFAEPRADWPSGAIATGFPYYDGGDGAWSAPSELQDFLNAGPAPVVFTLGSSAVMAPGRFFEESVLAARLAGHRAVLLVGKNRPPKNLAPDCLALDYAPYSALFPHACAIVHQGGIGTTAQALRAGRPALIVPHSLDQPDNAARAERLGTSRTIARRRYQARHVAAALNALLSQAGHARRAEEVARSIGAENGVGRACDAIESHLAGAGARLTPPRVEHLTQAGAAAMTDGLFGRST